MANEWPGLPYLARRLKDLPGDTPVAVYPWIPADAESSGMVPGYLIAASRIDLAGVELPTEDEPTTPPPPPPPPPPDPQIETWYVAVAKGQTLRLRSGAGTTFPVIGQLARGTELKIRGRFFVNDVTWTEVLEPVRGFAAADYLSLVHPDPIPPVVETETRYATGSGLRVRSAPDASSTILDVLDFAEAITVKKGVLVDGANGDTNKWRIRTVPSQGYVADQYLSLERPKADPPPEPPPSAGVRFGIIIHEDSENPAQVIEDISQAARDKVLRTVGLVNQKGTARHFCDLGVEYVVWRPVAGDNDSLEDIHGDERDIPYGRRVAEETLKYHQDLDRRAYVQPFATNEQHRSRDGWFWRGVFDWFIENGWLCAGFPDGIGAPGDFNEHPDSPGRFISPTWDSRVASGAMALGKKHGFLNTYHGYGRMHPLFSPKGDLVGWKETSDPGSGLWFDDNMQIIKRDDTAWFWFGGRALSVYYAIKPDGKPLIPPECRMDIVYGEARSSDAIYRDAREIIHDSYGYDLRFRDFPEAKGYHIWCAGRGWKFGYSAIDRGINAIAAGRKALPRL